MSPPIKTESKITFTSNYETGGFTYIFIYIIREHYVYKLMPGQKITQNADRLKQSQWSHCIDKPNTSTNISFLCLRWFVTRVWTCTFVQRRIVKSMNARGVHSKYSLGMCYRIENVSFRTAANFQSYKITTEPKLLNGIQFVKFMPKHFEAFLRIVWLLFRLG